MAEDYKVPMAFLKDYRFAFLLSSLLLLLVITPIIAEFHIVNILLSLLLSYILLTCILAISGTVKVHRIGLIMATPYFIMNWLYVYYPQVAWIERVDLFLGILFFSFVTLIMLASIMKSGDISVETIFAALSSYLLLGFTWSFIYALIDSFLPGSFNNISPDIIDPRYHFTYFSFTTLTTVGFGDVTPLNNVAESWTILEAIIGQLYLVVVIAGLVGGFVSRKRRENGQQ